MRNNILLAVGLLATLTLLLACVMLAVTAIAPSLATTAASTSTSDATQVCIGIFNIGACRSHQVTQATAPVASAPGGWNGNPWPFVVAMTVLIMGGTAAVLLSERRSA